MPNPKRGITTYAAVAADICACGHRVDWHNATTEACRSCTPAKKASLHAGGACTSIRTER